jgi:hypothetical protein
MNELLKDRLQNPSFMDMEWPRGLFNEALDRIEALEAALEKIADTDPDDGTQWFHDVANAALKEKSND